MSKMKASQMLLISVLLNANLRKKNLLTHLDQALKFALFYFFKIIT